MKFKLINTISGLDIANGTLTIENCNRKEDLAEVSDKLTKEPFCVPNSDICRVSRYIVHIAHGTIKDSAVVYGDKALIRI